MGILKRLGKMNTPAKVGLAIIVFNLVLAVFAPWIAPYGETDVVTDAWMPGFWDLAAQQGKPLVLLGSDQLGRDLLSRLIYGARNTISIAALTTAISFAIGITAGFAAATIRGWMDQSLSRGVDIVMALPSLILALLVITVMGSSVGVLIAVIALIDATRVFRLSRSVAMDVDVMPFVEAARLRGETLFWVLRREILPNTLAPLMAEFGIRFCFVFLFIASLSFIGLGIQPPAADWGSMVRENAAAISFGILTPLFPAAAIALLTVGVNLVVDWFLREAAGLRRNP
jgi:peptide/nickel transport system permease protein